MTYNVFSGTLNPTHSLTHLVCNVMAFAAQVAMKPLARELHRGVQVLVVCMMDATTETLMMTL